MYHTIYSLQMASVSDHVLPGNPEGCRWTHVNRCACFYRIEDGDGYIYGDKCRVYGDEYGGYGVGYGGLGSDLGPTLLILFCQGHVSHRSYQALNRLIPCVNFSKRQGACVTDECVAYALLRHASGQTTMVPVCPLRCAVLL